MWERADWNPRNAARFVWAGAGKRSRLHSGNASCRHPLTRCQHHLCASGSANRRSLPTSINAEAGRPLVLTSSSLSAMGTASSARLCRIIVLAFTFVADPYFSTPGRAAPAACRRKPGSWPVRRHGAIPQSRLAGAGRISLGWQSMFAPRGRLRSIYLQMQHHPCGRRCKTQGRHGRDLSITVRRPSPINSRRTRYTATTLVCRSSGDRYL